MRDTMAKQPDVLRAFPKAPGSPVWICQNLTKGTEYDVDVEQMTCNCRHFEAKRRCVKHLPFTLERAKLYAGDRQTYEGFAERWIAMDEADRKAVFA
jgi:hypothetical protein